MLPDQKFLIRADGDIGVRRGARGARGAFLDFGNSLVNVLIILVYDSKWL